MSVNAKRDYEKLTDQLLNSLMITGVEELNENPLVIQEFLERVAHTVSDRYIHSHYDWILFDSPMGFRSEDYIRDKLGLIVKWDGERGSRGTTAIYLPRDKYSCAEEVKAAIDMLHTIKHIKNELFDEHTKFKFFNPMHEKGVKNGIYCI